MATDSVMGLFATPQMIQQQQYNDALNQSMRMAQLTPIQQATAQARTAGYQLGGAIGGALGAQDPQLQMATQRQAIMKTIDPTNPESITKAAQMAAQTGDYVLSSKLAEEARNAAYKKAQTDRAANLMGATTASERNRSIIQKAETALASGQALTPQEEANVRWLISIENKPKVFRDPDTGEITKIDPINIAEAAPNIAKMLGKGKQSGTAGQETMGSIPTEGNQPETTGGGKLPTAIRKEVGDIDQQLVGLDTATNRLSTLIPEIDKIDLGFFTNLERSGAAYLGNPTADTKAFKQLQREALKQANNLLLLAKGVQTEGDAQRAKDQIADPDTWKNKELLKSAFADLKQTLDDTKAALKAKRSTVSSSTKTAPPSMGTNDIAPAKSSFSGVNPQIQPEAQMAPKATHRYNPATGRVEAL